MSLPYRVANTLRAAKRQVVDSERSARARSSSDWDLLKEHLSNFDGSASGNLLIASTGDRNMGDQAMLDAYVSAVRAPITVVAHPESRYRLPEGAKANIVVIPGLLGRSGAEHDAALVAFAELASRHSTLSVTGADIVDGGYSRRTASTLWAIAGATAESGRDSRILGFSWRKGVDASVREVSRRATRAGVVAYVRDPFSAERAQNDGLSNVRSVADTAFTLTNAPAYSSPTESHEVLVNVSGLIAKRVDLTSDYVDLVSWLVSAGYKVRLVAHVDSATTSDIAASDVIHRALSPDVRCHVVWDRELYFAEEIKQLAASARLVVTGRMHLSVLAMSVGVPALVLATQGKVDGLMSLVGLPDWCVDPVPGMATDLIGLIKKYNNNPEDFVSLLDSNLANVLASAALNFEGLS